MSKIIKGRKSLKLRAFSLTEVLIAMIIGSVLTGLVISTFITINKVYQKRLSMAAQNQKLIELSGILEQDFLRSDYVIKGECESHIVLHNDEPLSYLFTDSMIIRQNGTNADTFFLDSDNLSLHLFRTDNRLISQVQFNVLLNGLEYPVCIPKAYSRYDLYNYFLIKSESNENR